MGGRHTKALGKDLSSLLGFGALRGVLLWSAVAVRRRLDVGGAERCVADGRAVMRAVAVRWEGRPR